MIRRKYGTILEAWHGTIEELSYHHREIETVGQGGITTSYADGVIIEIADALSDTERMHLNMCSFGKTRFTQFLKRYFRPNLAQWVDDSVKQLGNLNKHQVAGYEVNVNPLYENIGRKGYGSSSKGHRHGACLSSLQLQHFPKSKVILFSRASQIDKAGFMDLSLIRLVALRTGWKEVSATWVISMGFIAAVSQMYYIRRFGKTLKGHSLAKSTERFWHDDHMEAKYGPQKRSIKRAQEFLRTGTVSRSCPVDELSLEF